MAPVDIVRTWVERLAAGDPASDMCVEDMVIHNWEESPAPGPYHGHVGLHEWFRDVGALAPDVKPFLVDDMTPLGDDRVLVKHRFVGGSEYTGIEFEQLWGSIITVRDGKIASAHGYRTFDEAREAAGL